jgi:hypothetical protein
MPDEQNGGDHSNLINYSFPIGKFAYRTNALRPA